MGGIAILVTVIGIGSAVAAMVLAFVLGTALLPGAEPFVLLLVWDGVIAAFLLLWIVGLLIQLQLGGESLSLEKLLHLPVSPFSAFLMNYLGSQMRVSLVIFLGAMLGLSAACIAVMGPAQVILFPLVLGFIALVTSVTHQFQSWLARLFVNKRRRGTVVAAAVLIFVLIANLPALVNRFFRVSDVSLFEHADLQGWTIVANAVLPPGWLALGAWGAGGTRVWIGLVAAAGMFAIAALSLRRAYRKTLGSLAKGDAKPADHARSEAAVPRHGARDPGWHDRLRGAVANLAVGITRYYSDQARAVAWVTLRIWLRAPQGKMVVLSPVLLVMLYLLLFAELGAGFWPTRFAPLAMIGFAIIMAFNLFANLFGQDGNGFRALVLAGVPSRELILGKNLALLPYALALGAVIIAVLQWLQPLPVGHVLANALQLVVLYLVGCMLGNAFSIRAPWPMSATSMGMRRATATNFLGSFLILVLLIVAIAPLAIPFAIERHFTSTVPLYLIVSILEACIAVLLYRRAVTGQARLLTERLESVLDRVTQPVD